MVLILLVVMVSFHFLSLRERLPRRLWCTENETLGGVSVGQRLCKHFRRSEFLVREHVLKGVTFYSICTPCSPFCAPTFGDVMEVEVVTALVAEVVAVPVGVPVLVVEE